ncbi:hypothetical protein TREES_T100008931 [Tupaia chinensis]|uniref:CRIB domain-containing protein n=1 Tax=Tupaia chinensis TaxID=246437 RepID=L9KYY3_TUPCH|nr:hypothetical protein TREES_T100008931 [Tupaia chinensis]
MVGQGTIPLVKQLSCPQSWAAAPATVSVATPGDGRHPAPQSSTQESPRDRWSTEQQSSQSHTGDMGTDTCIGTPPYSTFSHTDHIGPGPHTQPQAAYQQDLEGLDMSFWILLEQISESITSWGSKVTPPIILRTLLSVVPYLGKILMELAILDAVVCDYVDGFEKSNETQKLQLAANQFHIEPEEQYGV